jgi:hypothetical protein
VRRWKLPLVFVVTLAILGGVALILRAAGSIPPPAAPAPSPQPRRLFACAVPAGAPDFCQYLVQQMAHRNQLSDAEYRAAAPAGLDIARVVAAALPMGSEHCEPPTPLPTAGPAPCRMVRDPGGPPDPQQVEQALLAAGYPGAVVRLAAAGAPVPPGALLYAVPVGNACIIGYENSQAGSGSQAVVGTLPDHSCLSP